MSYMRNTLCGMFTPLAFNSPLRSSIVVEAEGQLLIRNTWVLQFSFEIFWFLCFLGFLSFVVYFEWLSLEWGFGVHWMSHPCSDGFDEGIE